MDGREMIAERPRRLPKCEDFRSRFDVSASAGFTLSWKATDHAAAALRSIAAC
jgi:hypothetical protein